MTRKKKIIITLSVIVLLTIIGFVIGNTREKVEYRTETVETKNIFQTVSVTGGLVSKEEINLNFETSGRIKSINAYIGKQVARGEVLATIDDNEFGQRLRQAEVALEQAIASAGANDDVIREAEESYGDAKIFLEVTESLEDQRVDAVDKEYEDAKEYYDAVESYYNQVVSDSGENSSEAKYARITLKSAQKSKNASEEAKSTARKARDLSIRSAENSLNYTHEKLKSAKSEYLKRSNNSAIESARAAYNLALLNLDKTSLTSPANGVITQITYKVGEVLGSASFDLTSSAITAFARMISSDFIIESQVPESDINKIKKGQNATVTFDAFEESDTFVAEVVEVEPASTVIQDVVYYKVKLRLSDMDVNLKAGMSCDIDIHTAEKSNVIAIPTRAIKEREGRKIVEILQSDQEIITKEVKTGLRGDNGLMEIVSGLVGGENLITFVLDEEGK